MLTNLFSLDNLLLQGILAKNSEGEREIIFLPSTSFFRCVNTFKANASEFCGPKDIFVSFKKSK